MISLEERKLALVIQAHQLQRELDNLKRKDYRESQLRTCAGRRAYVSFMDLITSFNSDSKRK